MTFNNAAVHCPIVLKFGRLRGLTIKAEND